MPVSKGRRKPKRTAPTPPPVKDDKVSPQWYVVLMFALMAIGGLVIIINYIGLLPGSPTNTYLFGGLGAIAVGFAMTLNYH